MYTTKELFEIISSKKEFTKYPNNRSLRHRHNKGVLSEESYTELFGYFGYEKPDKWVKKKQPKK